MSKEWRAEMLARVRAVMLSADAGIVETVKWRKPTRPEGVPVWEKDGIICTGETYRDKIKLTFARGAALDDPAGLFNASLDAGTRRAIDITEGHALNDKALKALVKAAAKLNAEKVAGKAAAKPKDG